MARKPDTIQQHINFYKEVLLATASTEEERKEATAMIPKLEAELAGVTNKGEAPEASKKIEMTVAELNEFAANLKKDILSELASKSQSTSQSDFKVLAEAIKKVNQDTETEEVFTEDTIDKDDYLETPAIFYAFKHYFSIVGGEKRYGQTVALPYKKLRGIEFTNMAAHIIGDSKFSRETKQLSVAKIFSKKEKAFLESSPNYKILFFPSVKGAMDADAQQAAYMSDAAREIDTIKDPYKLRLKAEELGITDPNDDFQTLRFMCIARRAKQIESFTKGVSRKSTISSDTDFNSESDRSNMLKRELHPV